MLNVPLIIVATTVVAVIVGQMIGWPRPKSVMVGALGAMVVILGVTAIAGCVAAVRDTHADLRRNVACVEAEQRPGPQAVPAKCDPLYPR